MRVGVVGAGWWAALAHIPGVLAHAHAELVGIADTDAQRLAMVADHLGVAGRFADHRELLAAGVDAVVVATPHATHYPIALDAIAAGAHVLVEKPLTLRAADARDLAARSEAAGVHLLTGYTFHFTAAAKLARDLIADGALGEIHLVHCLFTSGVEDFMRGQRHRTEHLLGGPAAATYADPRLSGGGQGQSQVTHAFGLMLWVTGLRGRRVSAYMSSCGAPVDLIDVIACELDNGALATITANGALAPGQTEQEELQYFGPRGTLVHDLLSGRLVLHPANGQPTELVPAGDDAYPVQAPVRSLIDVVRGDAESRTPASVSIATVELLEAAYRSAAGRGQPVDIGHE